MKKIIRLMMALSMLATLQVATAPAHAAGMQIAQSTTNKIATKAKSAHKTAITSNPKSVTVTHGGTARFTVRASGSNLRYEWQIQNRGQKSWHYFQRGASSTGTLTRAALSEHNASIRVLVTGTNGYKHSSVAKLKVNPALKPSISKVSHPKTNYAANATVTVTGKNFRDVHTVTYSGWSTYKLKFSKTSTSLKVTLPREYVPARARIVVTSNSGSSQIYLDRAEKLSESKRREYLSSYTVQKKAFGSPTGRVGSAVATALKNIQHPQAWDKETWTAHQIIDHGFRYHSLSKDVAKLQSIQKSLASEAKKNRGKKSFNATRNAAQQAEVKKEITTHQKLMDSELRSIRSLGGKV